MEDRYVADGLRARLVAALNTGHPADEACRQELASGALLIGPSGGQPVANVAGIYSRRVEHLHSKRIRFIGDDVVTRINASPYAHLRAAGVHGHDNFTIFLSPHDDEVVATIGVDGAVANQDFVWPETDL